MLTRVRYVSLCSLSSLPFANTHHAIQQEFHIARSIAVVLAVEDVIIVISLQLPVFARGVFAETACQSRQPSMGCEDRVKW